ncbi:MAG: HEAT repeat domain-containing protein [Gemmatimonadota bacterium]
MFFTDLVRALELTVADTALLVISGVIIALFGVTVVFSAYAVVLRYRHAQRDRLWAELRNRWEKPLLDAIADPESIPALQRLVEEKHQLYFVNYILEFSRRMRGEERAVLRTLVAPFLDEIGRRASHPNSQVRTRAMQTLGTLGLPAYEREVLAGLEDPSPLVSFVAARYLARAEFPQYGRAVLDSISRFDGANFRFLASMLASIGPTISPELRARLADPDRPDWERAVIAEALMMQREPRSGDVAADVLVQTRDRELSIRLLRLLGTVGRREHLEAIRARSTTDDVFVRAQALSAMGRLGDERDLPVLIAGMDDESPWVALHAARGIREAGGRGVLFELAQTELAYASLAGQVLYEEVEP